ncbi:MAG: hypothetical protein ACRCT1_07390 [Microcoleaceae cyanobacterium]
MNRNEITQKTTLFEALREIQIDIENIQAKFAYLEENWEGFPDTFPVEYPLDTEESDED